MAHTKSFMQKSASTPVLNLREVGPRDLSNVVKKLSKPVEETVREVDAQVRLAGDPILKWVVEHSKKNEDVRFRAHGTSHSTKLYEIFQQRLRELENETRSLGKKVIFQMDPHYDTRSYECRDIPSKHPGSLRLLFNYYCKLMTPSNVTTGLDTSKGLTYDLIQVANETMSLPELIMFAHDFQIIPNLTTSAGIHFCWQRQRRGRMYDNAPTELDYRSFVEVLARIALISFDEDQDPRERVWLFSQYMDLKQTHKYRKMLKDLEHKRKWRERLDKAVGQQVVEVDMEALESISDEKDASIFSSAYSSKSGLSRPRTGSLMSRQKSSAEDGQFLFESIPGQRQAGGKNPKQLKINFELQDQKKQKWSKIKSFDETLQSNAQKTKKSKCKLRTENKPAKPKAKQVAFAETNLSENGNGRNFVATHVQNRVRKGFWGADALFSSDLIDMLNEHEFENDRVLWLPFGGEYLDLGVLVQGSEHFFKVQVRNTWRASISVTATLSASMQDVTATIDSRMMPMGMVRNIILCFNCLETGERVGYLLVSASDRDGNIVQTRELPIYLNIVERVVDHQPVGQAFTTKHDRVSSLSPLEIPDDEDLGEAEATVADFSLEDFDQSRKAEDEEHTSSNSVKPGMSSFSRMASTKNIRISPKHSRSKSVSVVTGLSLPSPLRRLTSVRALGGKLEQQDRKPLPLSLVPEPKHPKTLLARRITHSLLLGFEKDSNKMTFEI